VETQEKSFEWVFYGGKERGRAANRA